GVVRYVPQSPALWASHRAAALTALALLVGARPRARPLSGQVLWLGGGAGLAPLAGGVPAGSFGDLAVEGAPLPPRAPRPVPCGPPSCPRPARPVRRPSGGRTCWPGRVCTRP